MEVIDGNWLRARLSGRHGEQRELAEAVGLTSDKITKILKGDRAIRAHEIPRFMAYFDSQSHAGFSERIADFTPGPLRPVQMPSVQQIGRMIAPAARNPSLYLLSRAVAWAGLLAGDYLVVELAAALNPGDLVVVTLNDTAHDIQTTELRRYLPPLLVDMAPDAPSPAMPAENSLEVAIVATVCGVVRAPQLPVV